MFTCACLIAATGIEAVGAAGGGGLAAGGGTDGAAGFGGGVAGLGSSAFGVGGGGGDGAAAAGFGASDGAAAAPPVAPISMLHNFWPGFTVSPSWTKSSFMTPEPGDGTGTEVCKCKYKINCRHNQFLIFFSW